MKTLRFFANTLAATIAVTAPLACGGTGAVDRQPGGAGSGGNTSGSGGTGGNTATGGAGGGIGGNTANGGAGGAGGSGGASGVTVCAPESDAAFCSRLGKACGSVTANDNCGASRSVANCGTCTPPATCSATNACTCAAETNTAFCSRLGRNCGAVTAADNCGTSRTVASCGNCTTPDVCSAGNVCGPANCVAETDTAFCSRQSKACGAVTSTDNCGTSRTVASCGTCTPPATCGATNVCSCTPEGSADFCTRLIKACGSVTANDNCGASRTVTSCGTCTPPQTCAGNVCAACVAETDAVFCSRLGKNCNGMTGPDNCGTTRTVASCGVCTAPATCGGGGIVGVCGTFGSNPVEVVQTSRAGDHCTAKPSLTPVPAAASTKTVITVDTAALRQSVYGFGTSLTEVVTSTIAILAKAQRDEILNKLFGAAENNYQLVRTTIGASDFSLGYYTYDDAADTDALPNFSTARDDKWVIPGILAAKAVNPNLKVLSSPWTAPAWMRNGNMGNMSLLPAKQQAWANYFVKFIQQYQAKGVPIWAVTAGNESTFGDFNVRPCLSWTAASQASFINGFLGPALKAANLTPKLYVYDHNHGPATSDAFQFASAANTTAKQYYSGTAVHWYGSSWQTNTAGQDAIHGIDATKEVIFTEATPDGLIFGPTKNMWATAPWWQNDDWYWTKSNYDWGYDWAPGPAHVAYHSVYRYARDMIAGLNHWYTGWIEWNGVMNKYGAQEKAGGGIGTIGQPGVSYIRNGHVTEVMVDEDPSKTDQTATIYYTPLYYTMRHFSKYIMPGAKIATTTVTLAAGITATDYDNTPLPDGVAMYAVGALNPDNTTAVVIFNQTKNPIDYTLKVGTRQVDSTAPAQSLQTLIWH